MREPRIRSTSSGLGMGDRRTLEMARQALAAGDYQRAAHIYRTLHAQRPKDTAVLYALGSCLSAMHQRHDAETCLRKVLKSEPKHIGALHDLALLHIREARLDEAMRFLDRALDASPGHARILSTKAGILMVQDKLGEAMAIVEPAIRAGTDSIYLSISFAELCLRLGRAREGIEHLEPRLAAPLETLGYARVNALFTLSQLHEKLKDYDRAFDAARRANEIKVARFDPEAFTRAVDLMTLRWNRESITRARNRVAMGTCADRSARLVFIVGMPRSGTSLVEQVLASHPSVHASGELPFMDEVVSIWSQGFSTSGMALWDDPEALDSDAVRKAARRYLDEAERRSRSAAIVTDKMPLNFRFLGLIQIMFPQARIIHCRRHPLDTCVSCHMRHFAGSNPYTSDLRHLGHFYRQYERIISHWKSVLDVPILDISYEDVVDDLEGQTRRMLEFLGLPWHDGCLKFYETSRVTMTLSNDQVRQPLYRSSVARHERYAVHLGPLREALGLSGDATGTAAKGVVT